MAATLKVLTMGPPLSGRKVSVTDATDVLAFARSTNVLKKPSDPSAKYHFWRGPSTAVPPCDP